MNESSSSAAPKQRFLATVDALEARARAIVHQVDNVDPALLDLLRQHDPGLATLFEAGINHRRTVASGILAYIGSRRA